MRQIDAKGSKLSDALFAEAYRTLIPGLTDAKYVTIRMHTNRATDLSMVESDLSDVVEVGQFTEKGLGDVTRNVTRVVAVPVTVHPKDGAELVVDDNEDPTKVVFCVNGIPELEVVNMSLSSAEIKAKKSADEEMVKSAKAADDAQFEKDIADAKERGRKAELLKQAEAAGAASVTPAPVTPAPPSV